MNNLQIIAETSNYLVIDKPCGIQVEKSLYYPSIEQWVTAYLKAQQPKKEPFVGIVHRLDRPVSGVLLIAKKKSYLTMFNEAFRLRLTKKTYSAWLEHKPTSPAATLEHYLSVDKKEKKAIIFDKAVKNATKVSLSYVTLPQYEEKNIIEIELHTGKFHQIRAQLAAIGTPIVGDEKYGAISKYRTESIALHAMRLFIKDTILQQDLTFESPKEW
jgi:23S rRNA pseudouridine1911/1915/1917 synthase